ncbi:hypothetical protein OnM2_060038 [Erysiphe neolycopersici]|uniref:Uncharacterized protein n=1 Tax=Erysiphe neolycopersici TaxID=212602 RepID=A0A420HPR8_9PEZI|nr:hypothetical protein OnM2_060038 [Erysiphe neolycopersici]
MEERAFCVPAVIRTKKGGRSVDVRLPSTVAQADTGSDMVVISYGLVKYLDLPMKLLSENGFSGLTMNVANGTSSPLKYFTSFRINVLGISRNVEAFVRPWNAQNEEELHLLLGLPWLHDANAKIYIRDSIIEIGDPDRSENVLQVKDRPGQVLKLYQNLRPSCEPIKNNESVPSNISEEFVANNIISQPHSLQLNEHVHMTTFDHISPPFIDTPFTHSQTSSPRLNCFLNSNLLHTKLKSYSSIIGIQKGRRNSLVYALTMRKLAKNIQEQDLKIAERLGWKT